MRSILMVLLLITCLPCAIATEWHIALDGDDDDAGTAAAPWRSPAAADARLAPGDSVVVHGGTWREVFAPSTGGTADAPVTWRAAAGETVILSASEPATAWHDLGDGRWRLSLDTYDLDAWNPYAERMKEGPLPESDRHRSCGMVWRDGDPLREVDTPDDVTTAGTWAPNAAADAIVAHFGTQDPAAHQIAISVREQCFSPSVWNLGHVVVDGFIIEHAANDYDDFFGKAESAPQHGALSTFGGHDWTIRNNTVRDCVAIGIDFGLQGRAAMNEFGTPDRFGHHLLRNNRVLRCGASGMIAYKGPFCTVRDNLLVGNGWQDVGGHGKAALKLISECVDSLVVGNCFRDNRGDGPHGYSSLWIDWAFQGSRLSGNLFVDTDRVWIEASHGPTLFDANILIGTDLWCTDGGGVAALHNAFIDCDTISIRMLVPNVRSMQYFAPHSLERIGKEKGAIQDYLFAANLFIGTDLDLPQDGTQKGQPVRGNVSDHNVFLAGGRPKDDHDAHSLRLAEGSAAVTVDAQSGAVSLQLSLPAAVTDDTVPITDSTFIGQRNRYVDQTLPGVDVDYYGHDYGPQPIAGPFATVQAGAQNLRLWPTDGQRAVDLSLIDGHDWSPTPAHGTTQSTAGHTRFAGLHRHLDYTFDILPSAPSAAQ